MGLGATVCVVLHPQRTNSITITPRRAALSPETIYPEPYVLGPCILCTVPRTVTSYFLVMLTSYVCINIMRALGPRPAAFACNGGAVRHAQAQAQGPYV